MTQCYEFHAPGGLRCRWRIHGKPACEFFAFLARTARLIPCDASETPDLELFSVTPQELDAVEARPVGNLHGILKARQDAAGRSVCFGDFSHPLDAMELLLLRRAVFFLAFFPLLLAGCWTVLHGALLSNGRDGLLLTGPSGIGKSTCAAKALPPWEALCDDALLVSLAGGTYHLQPLPTWSRWLDPAATERSYLCRTIVPLRAIGYLEQGSSDTLSPLTPFQARLGIGDSSSVIVKGAVYAFPKQRQPALLTASYDFSRRMAGEVPAYRLTNTLAGRPWEQLPGLAERKEFA